MDRDPAPGVEDARWAPSGFRIAYREGDTLRVVVGDGTNDHLLARAAAPSRPPGSPMRAVNVLAYVDADGRIRVLDVDTRAELWSVRSPASPASPSGPQTTRAYSRSRQRAPPGSTTPAAARRRPRPDGWRGLFSWRTHARLLDLRFRGRFFDRLARRGRPQAGASPARAASRISSGRPTVVGCSSPGPPPTSGSFPKPGSPACAASSPCRASRASSIPAGRDPPRPCRSRAFPAGLLPVS